MEKEMTSVLEIGAEAVVGTLLLFFAVTLILFGKQWYSDEVNYQGSKEDVAKAAEEYAIIDRDSVTGADIVEYILKYGSTYDYIIDTYQKWYITKDYALSLYRKNKNGGIIWTENYLTESVFNNRLTDEFTVTAHYLNDEIIGYTFTRKK